MAQVRVMRYNVGADAVESSEAGMATWLEKGWQIAGTAMHGENHNHTLWVTFVKL